MYMLPYERCSYTNQRLSGSSTASVRAATVLSSWLTVPKLVQRSEVVQYMESKWQKGKSVASEASDANDLEVVEG